MKSTVLKQEPNAAERLEENSAGATPISDQTMAEFIEPLNRIKVESVLSRYPIHNLTKQTSVEILIQRNGEKGDLEFHWEVSPNAKSGQPRTLAYRIDCLVVNRRLDEAPRPLPPLIRLGSLRQICQELDLVDSGKNKEDLKAALKQNAGAMISAKLKYRGRDNSEHRFEHYFNRYNVIFTGDKLSDGRVADAVYLSLTEPYRQLLNNAPTRPLDYDYLKKLTPMAQRFYELLTYRVYRAIKTGEPHARLLYSEYCLAVPQERKFTPRDIKRQMSKVHEQHLAAAYIKGFEIEQFTAADGQPDFWLLYELGTRAYGEFRAFNTPRAAVALPDQTSRPNVSSGQGEQGREAPEPLPANQEAELLVRLFHEGCGHDVNQPPRPKELQQAATLLAKYGLATAQFIVSYGLAEARKSNFEMRYFGAILGYEFDGAKQAQTRLGESGEAKQQQQEDDLRQVAEQRYAQMDDDERQARAARADQMMDICNVTKRDDWRESDRPQWVHELVIGEIMENLRAARRR